MRTDSPLQKKRGRLMTFVWIGLALVAAVVVIGFLMPERYTGRSSVVYAASAEDVWGALLDYDRHPMTGKMKKGVEARPAENGLPVWAEDMGRGELITVKTVAAQRPARMTREMNSQSVPMTSRWEYTLEPLGVEGGGEGGGCRLTIAGETHIKSGTWHVPLFRVMMVLGGGVKRGLDIQMDMVAATLGVEARRE